jgi:hypothetical protein
MTNISELASTTVISSSSIYCGCISNSQYLESRKEVTPKSASSSIIYVPIPPPNSPVELSGFQ